MRSTRTLRLGLFLPRVQIAPFEVRAKFFFSFLLLIDVRSSSVEGFTNSVDIISLRAAIPAVLRRYLHARMRTIDARLTVCQVLPPMSAISSLILPLIFIGEFTAVVCSQANSFVIASRKVMNILTLGGGQLPIQIGHHSPPHLRQSTFLGTMEGI